MRITEGAKKYGENTVFELLSAQLTVTQAGHLYVWLVNDVLELGEGPLKAYFDDFKIDHTRSPDGQSNDYYPFGLTFNSYQSENSTKDNYSHNRNEKQDELDLGWIVPIEVVIVCQY